MGVVSTLLARFNAGELSPRLAALLDFSKYPAGLETLENLVPLAEGGLTRKPGTRYVATAKDSTVKSRLKRFQFSTTQAYMLEMGNQVLRFYRHQTQISVADTDAAVTNGTFDSGITDWDDRSTGAGSIAHDATNSRLSLLPGGATAPDIGWAEQDITVGAGNQGNEHVLKFQVIGAPGDKVEFQVGTTSTGAEVIGPVEKEVGYHCVAFTPGATTFYIQFRNLGSFRNKTVQIDNVSLIDNAGVEIDTPYLEADLFQVEGPQTADVLYLFNGSRPTHKLTRLGHTTWSLVEVEWKDGPWLDQNTTTTTLTFSAATGLGVTVTASATEGINGGAGFKATDVGRLIRLTDNTTTNWGYAIITGFTSSTVVTADVRRTVTVITAETTWRLGAWSGTTGYPAVAGFFQQRLFPAGSADAPQRFDASNTGDFETFSPDSPVSGVWDGTVQDDDSFSYTIDDDEVNVIRWIKKGKKRTLVIGTVGGEWLATSNGVVLKHDDISVDLETGHGSAQVNPVRVGNVILFLQVHQRKIREFVFDFQTDGFRAPDMTRLAEHIAEGGIVEMDYAEEPDSILWAVRADGQLLGFTYRRDEDALGWARHIAGGSFGAGAAVVESVAVIPGANGAGQVQSSEERDEVWVIVKRTINGATVRYIEVLEGYYNKENPAEDAYYSDSIITYDGVSTTAISGLDHLEGETVKIWADGAVHADKVVASGGITLDAAAQVVQVGLGYTHKMKILKHEGGNEAGTALGKIKRYIGATFVLLDTHLLTFGPDSGNLETKEFRVIDDVIDAAAPLKTGEAYFTMPKSNYEADPRIVIESDSPSPFTLLAISPVTDVKRQARAIG